MPRVVRLYFNAVFGALGGLVGWLLFGQLVPNAWSWQVNAVVGGAIIGGTIGYFVVSVDALLSRAPLRFIRYAAVGSTLGALGGAVGFLVGDWVNFQLVPRAGAAPWWAAAGGAAARALGWSVFGLAVGLAEGIAARSLRKLYYGLLGGTLGGLVGGLCFGWLMVALQPGEQSYLWGQALGLMILGACIGCFAALVEEVLKPASLRVLRGWQEGREYPVLKTRSTVGRDEAVDILVLRDMGVAKRHVEIVCSGGRFELHRREGDPEQTLVNDQMVANSVELKDGDRVQLGSTVLRFHRRAATRAVPVKR